MTVLERAWSIYKMMHSDAHQERKEKLEAFIQQSQETNPERQITAGLAYLMTLDLEDS
jgi:hypothetical protein